MGAEEGLVTKKARKVAALTVLRFDRIIKLLAGTEAKLTQDERRELREAVEGLPEGDIAWLEKFLKHGGRLMVLLVLVSITMHRVNPNFSFIGLAAPLFAKKEKADNEAQPAAFAGVPG